MDNEKDRKILVIAEKPSVAGTIADIIGAKERKEGYLEGDSYIVSWCIGHLAEPAEPEKYCEAWKKWDYGTLPMIPDEWKYDIKPETSGQFKVLKQLMHDKRVESLVCATDAGREGELIFRLVYEQAGCQKPVMRLWISSMEESAVLDGFAHLKQGKDYDHLYESALCRQRADWLVGLNGTRLFSVLYGRMMKVGRVQTPTLAMLVEREEKIRIFKKEQYFMAHIMMGEIDAVSEKVSSREEAENMASVCNSITATVKSVIKEKKAVPPPKLYDLTSLQRDANRIFGFTAKQTLEYTQFLYEKKLATYPRTDSQYLSDDMEETAKGIIAALYQSFPVWGQPKTAPDIKKLLNSKKVTDHHAIIPTAEIAKADLSALPEGERKILCLIANRLLCASAEKYEYEAVRAEFICFGIRFSFSGRSVLNNGWKETDAAFHNYFKVKEEKEKEADDKMPDLSEGMEFDSVQTKVTEHYTQPPKHFTEDSLLLEMERAGAEEMGDDVERRGLGTPATRADIIEKLVQDGFVKRDKKQMLPTEDGIKLITVLPDIVKSPKLTADWENALTLVSKGGYSMQEFMGGIEDMVKGLVRTYHSISEDQKAMFANEKRNVLGKCPKCGGEIVEGKFGAYCRNKCGMNASRVLGVALTDSQTKNLLEGKKTLVKGLKSKAGKTYDAYIIPEGIEEYSYMKDGKETKGSQYKVKLEFPANPEHKSRIKKN